MEYLLSFLESTMDLIHFSLIGSTLLVDFLVQRLDILVLLGLALDLAAKQGDLILVLELQVIGIRYLYILEFDQVVLQSLNLLTPAITLSNLRLDHFIQSLQVVL
jgi:hypothetical protein